MKPFRECLREARPIVADGAMGTMLMERGLQPGAPPESFALDHPEVIESVTRAYVEAGAEIVQTNTFGASPLRLADHGLEARCEEVNRRATEVARRAAGDRAHVSGSCGPCGRWLPPHGNVSPGGDVSPEEVLDGFRRQIRALAGADLICIETMTALDEACLAVRAAREVSPETPVMATMTFERTPRGFYTVMGVSVAAAARGLTDAGADVIGSNCGNGSRDMLEVARAFRSVTGLPIIIQPNAGLPESREGRLVYRETPEDLAATARELVSIGVKIAGGCCGTTPGHVRAMREAVGRG